MSPGAAKPAPKSTRAESQNGLSVDSTKNESVPASLASNLPARVAGEIRMTCWWMILTGRSSNI
jgi:hypothetical protein